jgi:integrase
MISQSPLTQREAVNRGWACKNDLIQKNPRIGVKLPQVTNTTRCLTRRVAVRDQIDALVATPHEPYATLVSLIQQTGLRIGEAVALKEFDSRAMSSTLHVGSTGEKSAL